MSPLKMQPEKSQPEDQEDKSGSKVLVMQI